MKAHRAAPFAPPERVQQTPPLKRDKEIVATANEYPLAKNICCWDNPKPYTEKAVVKWKWKPKEEIYMKFCYGRRKVLIDEKMKQLIQHGAYFRKMKTDGHMPCR